ncbi:uncharacterized protein STEHIDRAFT_166389 [Stereum hirsutum FP-91666 SS1]|uniref:uncharacterized protein n=1 Tax=Stereum hirsutum (strain FP-91666) TaxID=721885 RepID=UPI000440E70B|nr:uncharacterized protein STEHIDRAFT_166389 [Stereum hirsutum FP-91666 SS1]EIM90139.1 hypothetical protein STEHIDRAFT_166389 [Stereum hirsutum FP-91666 SS1]
MYIKAGWCPVNSQAFSSTTLDLYLLLIHILLVDPSTHPSSAIMQLTFASTFAVLLAACSSALASPTPRQSCSEASRYGATSLSNSNLAPGDAFTLTWTDDCGAQYNIIPKYVDFSIVPSSGASVIIGRYDYDGGAEGISFDTTLPAYYYESGATFNVKTTLTYPNAGPTGEQVLVQGGLYTPLTITSSS